MRQLFCADFACLSASRCTPRQSCLFASLWPHAIQESPLAQFREALTAEFERFTAAQVAVLAQAVLEEGDGYRFIAGCSRARRPKLFHLIATKQGLAKA